MLFGILLTLNIIVCLGLIAVVLLQRSEGGALGMGGGPTGFVSARGAGDLLTRTTWILFSAFLVISLALTLLSGRQNGSSSITSKLKIDGLDPNSLNAPPPPAAPAVTPVTPAQSQPGPIQAPAPGLNPLLPAAPAGQATQPKLSAAPAAPAAQPKKPAAPASRAVATPSAPSEQSQPAAPAEQPAQQQ